MANPTVHTHKTFDPPGSSEVPSLNGPAENGPFPIVTQKRFFTLKAGLFNQDRGQMGKQIWARFTEQEKNVQNTKRTLSQSGVQTHFSSNDR